MSRKQIGLRMKDETRDQLEKIRGSLSRTAYVEGAVLAQIARDLERGTTISRVGNAAVTEDDMIIPSVVTTTNGERISSSVADHFGVLAPSGREEEDGVDTVLAGKNNSSYGRPIRSSAESKANVLPLPKKAEGRK